jgi:hypothetical protein
MNKLLTSLKSKFSIENILLLIFYVGIFSYLISIPAIYSPATNSFWHIGINRYPVYVLFIRTVHFLFANYYDLSLVAIQLLFGLLSVHIFFKNTSSILRLNLVFKGILLLILVFPFFSPLYTANNICSEGLSYPLYLLLISFSIDFIFREKTNRIYLLIAAYLFLILTRGQFSTLIPIILLLFILKHKKQVFKKTNLKFIILLVLIPFVANTLDSSYRQIVHGHFVTTPFSYVNAITLPLFISTKADTAIFKNKDHRAIFLKSYNRIDSLNLLSSKVVGNNKAKYKVFHDNFPYICNLNFYTQGADHYYMQHFKIFKSFVDIEVGAKEMFPILVKEHFKEWLSLYFTNVLHGFKSIFILIFFIGVWIYSGFASLKKFNLENGLLFMGSTLILTNGFLVAFVVHSILRYSFYNFAFVFIILIILYNKLTRKYETGI